MAQFYTLTSVSKMGDPWEAHGNSIQTWWCEVEGEKWPVSIGKKVGTSLHVGMNLYGGLEKARSKKGTDYWKFRGSQVPEGTERPKDAPAPIGTDFEERLAKLEAKVFGGEPAPVDTTDHSDEPISLEDIPF